MRLTVLGLLLSLSSQVFAGQDKKPLPDPLSLEQAIQLIDESHPKLAQVQLKAGQSQVDLLEAENLKSLQISADARLRWVEPGRKSTLFSNHEDHRLRLTISKPLYDAGYSDALSTAANLGIQAALMQYKDARDRYVIKVMRDYFEIILADLRTSRDLEAMSVAFVRMDKARDYQELGMISDIDFLEFQSRYQDVRKRFYFSEGEARRTRVSLALSLNRPGQQPSLLVPPELKFGKAKLLPYEDLLKRILSDNRSLKSRNSLLEAARSRAKAARVKYRPNITSEIQRAEYSRDTATADKWRLGVEIKWPLYDGGRTDAALKRAQLAVTQVELDIKQLRLDLQHQVRELSENVRTLKAEGDASLAFADYRDLYLDRSRALYDLEFKTDLGDAMVEVSKSLIRSAEQKFQLALVLAQLNMLAGEPVMDWQALTVKKPPG